MMINGVQLWSESWERPNFIYLAARMHSFEALAFDNNNTMISELHVCSKIITYIKNLDFEIVLNSNIYIWYSNWWASRIIFAFDHSQWYDSNKVNIHQNLLIFITVKICLRTLTKHSFFGTALKQQPKVTIRIISTVQITSHKL